MASALVQGARCEIKGLVAAAQHNGKRCTLTQFREDVGRYRPWGARERIFRLKSGGGGQQPLGGYRGTSPKRTPPPP